MKRTDHHLVQKVLDGDIDQSAFDDFQNRMRKEADLVELYTDYALLHHTLHEEVDGGGALGGFLDTPREGSKAYGLALVIALLALCLLGWGGWKWIERRYPSEAAVATFSLDATWNLKGVSRVSGGATGLKTGAELELLSGRASISLKPSVQAVIEGPAKIIIASEDTLHLETGRGFFQRKGNHGRLKVTTPKLTALDSGTEFVLETIPAAVDELHVVSGQVSIRANVAGRSHTLAAGEMARIFSSGLVETQAFTELNVPSGLGRFTPVVSGEFKPEAWQIRYGKPSIAPRRMEGANFSAYMKLPGAIPEHGVGVMLVSLELGKAAATPFHTEGWAGMSFYHNGVEKLFFGDLFRDRPTWGMDVKHGVPVIMPNPPIVGEKKVTLRYDARNGDVSLHEGGLPLAHPFASGKLPPGTRFDEIRIAASAGASLAVNSLQILTRTD